MASTTERLKRDLINCVGSDTLPSHVRLPCVGVQPVAWANKTIQQKTAEVLGALQVFQDGVKWAKNQNTLQTSPPACQTSLLDDLEHNMTNYRLILNKLLLQKDMSHSAVQHCSSQTSLNKVLDHYRKLLKGKLELLATDLHDRTDPKHGNQNWNSTVWIEEAPQVDKGPKQK